MCDCEARLQAIERRIMALEQKKTTPRSGADWLAELKANPLFSHVDFASEERKIAIWKMKPANINRQITKRFWLNWLAKVDTTVPVAPVKPVQPLAQRKIETVLPIRKEYNPPPAEVMELLNRIGKRM